MPGVCRRLGIDLAAFRESKGPDRRKTAIPKSGRKKVQSCLKQDRAAMVEVTQSDVKAICGARALPPPVPEQVQESENINVVFLTPKRGSFEGEASKWSFRKGGRQGEVVQATIRDTEFLGKLERGEYRLTGGDVLKVELKERQRVVGADIKTTNEILKVLHYQPAPDQSRMEFDGGPDTKF